MNEKKIKVLVSIDWYLPGFKAGGPIRSVANLVEALGDHCHFSILTSDADYGDKMPYPNIVRDEWVDYSPSCRIWYASGDKRSYRHIRTIIKDTDYDVLYLNSMFSLRFTIYTLWNSRSLYPEKPIILAPRGMLHPGALGLKSRKKKIFLAFIRLVGVHKHIIFQATDKDEKTDIRKVFGDKMKIVDVPNLPKMENSPLELTPKAAGSLKIIFLSRISVKKGVHYLLQRLSEQSAQIEFDIYGPDEEPGYWKRCQEIIDRLPENIKVRKCDPVQPEVIQELMQRYHLFAMPTLGENFGHAIFEALSAGRPVLISNQTPWEGLENGAGAAIPLKEKAKFAQFISDFASMNQAKWDSHAQAAWQYALDFRKGHEGINLSVDMFRGAVAGPQVDSSKKSV